MCLALKAQRGDPPRQPVLADSPPTSSSPNRALDNRTSIGNQLNDSAARSASPEVDTEGAESLTKTRIRVIDGDSEPQEAKEPAAAQPAEPSHQDDADIPVHELTGRDPSPPYGVNSSTFR
jgi:hypothetical protein